jgi:hypothetical protein
MRHLKQIARQAMRLCPWVLLAFSAGAVHAGCAGLIVAAGTFTGGNLCLDNRCASRSALVQIHYVCISDANFDAQGSAYGAYNAQAARGAINAPAAAAPVCPPNSFRVVTGTSQ